MAMKNLLSALITWVVLLLLPVFCYAGDHLLPDSAAPVTEAVIKGDTGISFANYLSTTDEKEAEAALHELADIEHPSFSKSVNSRKLGRLLRITQVKKLMRHSGNRQRVLLDMAGISAQLKLYPFAMQCFYQSISRDSAREENELIGSGAVQFHMFFSGDTPHFAADEPPEKISWPVDPGDILNSFDDGKDVAACAVLLHVKQPSPGKRKAFVGLNNVGHTFITLIKYNTDSSVVSRSFGFYPRKENLLTATPFHPAAISVIKDDGFHDWDQVVGKFISYRRLRRILRMLDKLESKQYDLNTNNCTDFGLYVAMIGGIDLRDTKGRWPFGKGNNPASTGQSLLEGKLINADTGNTDGLFLWKR